MQFNITSSDTIPILYYKIIGMLKAIKIIKKLEMPDLKILRAEIDKQISGRAMVMRKVRQERE